MRNLLTFLLALTVASTAPAQLTPGPPVEDGSTIMVVADLDRNGLDDLISNRKVMLNNGGTFSAAFELPLLPGERVIGALDVNADRLPDLLTVVESFAYPPSTGIPSTGGTQYRVLAAAAPLTYPNATELPRGGLPPAIVDADGDRLDDILHVAPVYSGIRTIAMDVIVVRSVGDGTFESLPPVRVPSGVTFGLLQRAQAGDIDRDGVTDIVLRSEDDFVLLRGTGGGRFTVETRYLPGGFGREAMRLVDVDGDGNLDIVQAGQRILRVFLGDGRGNFPRFSSADIAQRHDGSLPKRFVSLSPGYQNVNQPRTIAVGQFTGQHRLEIAAGMGEGDIVVFAWQNGSLREVSRTETEFWLVRVHTGAFKTPGATDLYASSSVTNSAHEPRPRVFHSSSVPAAMAERDRVRTPMRRRSLSTGGTVLELDVTMKGECVPNPQERWTIRHDGMFGTHVGDSRVDTVFVDGLFFRLTAPWLQAPVQGFLMPPGDSTLPTFSAAQTTQCGWKEIAFTAVPR